MIRLGSHRISIARVSTQHAARVRRFHRRGVIFIPARKRRVPFLSLHPFRLSTVSPASELTPLLACSHITGPTYTSPSRYVVPTRRRAKRPKQKSRFSISPAHTTARAHILLPYSIISNTLARHTQGRCTSCSCLSSLAPTCSIFSTNI